MARFQNFRSRINRGFNSFKNRGRGFRRRSYSSKFFGMKMSSIFKIAILGIVGFMLKDKILPFIQGLTKKK